MTFAEWFEFLPGNSSKQQQEKDPHLNHGCTEPMSSWGPKIPTIPACLAVLAANNGVRSVSRINQKCLISTRFQYEAVLHRARKAAAGTMSCISQKNRAKHPWVKTATMMEKITIPTWGYKSTTEDPIFSEERKTWVFHTILQCLIAYLIQQLIWLHWPSNHSPGHLIIGFLCHGKDVRIHIPHVLATVRVDDILSVDWQLLIWINGDKYNTLEQINGQICYKPSTELILQAF